MHSDFFRVLKSIIKKIRMGLISFFLMNFSWMGIFKEQLFCFCCTIWNCFEFCHSPFASFTRQKWREFQNIFFCLFVTLFFYLPWFQLWLVLWSVIISKIFLQELHKWWNVSFKSSCMLEFYKVNSCINQVFSTEKKF